MKSAGCSFGQRSLPVSRSPHRFISSSHCFSSRRLQCSASGQPILEIKNLCAKVVGQDKEILKGLTLTINAGETHAIMGKNGSGKSTLSKCLVGHPDYEITNGTASYRGEDLLALEPEERARKGLFMSFQSPVEIPGVSNSEFLRLAANTKRKARGEDELDPMEFFGFIVPKLQMLKMDLSFLDRDVNSGFSGGERKRNEILQLAVLEAEMSILDEIDSGLDIDALREVATAVNGLRTKETATLMVTHYQRLLNYIEPDHVHVMEAGRIIYSGGKEVAGVLETDGYEGVRQLLENKKEPQAVQA